ncbi:MAG: twin-arginine translocation signal domain-containing protein [Bryobacteraceae bacterium]
MEKQQTSSNRREFMKTASATAGAALTLGFPAIISAQTVTNALKVGLIGCGARGTGAANEALHADGDAELTAVGDVFQRQIDAALPELARIAKVAGRSKLKSQTSSSVSMPIRRS